MNYFFGRCHNEFLVNTLKVLFPKKCMQIKCFNFYKTELKKINKFYNDKFEPTFYKNIKRHTYKIITHFKV